MFSLHTVCTHAKRLSTWLLATLVCAMQPAAFACTDALVAVVTDAGDRIVIGDYGCHYPQNMVFKLGPSHLAADGSWAPQEAVPFVNVCRQLPKGRFSCGARAPFGLANTAWQPTPGKRRMCPEDPHPAPRYVCTSGCKALGSRIAFEFEAHECE